jgi:hypothetical protein
MLKRRSKHHAPNDLPEMCDSTLERICKQSERDRDLTIKVVAWISRARCPLTVDEVRHALSLLLNIPMRKTVPANWI